MAVKGVPVKFWEDHTPYTRIIHCSCPPPHSKSQFPFLPLNINSVFQPVKRIGAKNLSLAGLVSSAKVVLLDYGRLWARQILKVQFCERIAFAPVLSLKTKASAVRSTSVEAAKIPQLDKKGYN